MKPGTPGDDIRRRPKRNGQHPLSPLLTALRAVLMALLLWLAWSAAFVFYASPDSVSVVVGEPSPRDIRAPREVTYVSAIRTEEARMQAAAAVSEIMRGPDMTIATSQLAMLENVVHYFTAVRDDPYSDLPTKIDLITGIPDVAISPDVAIEILDLSAPAWSDVTSETTRVLDLVLRDEIVEGQVAEAQRRVDRLLRHDLSTAEQKVVSALAQDLVVPNTFLDVTATAAARQTARDAVEPVHWTIRQNESVLREGEIVTDVAYEKLQVLGLLDTGLDWRAAVGDTLLSLVLVVVLGLFVARTQPSLLGRPRRELLLVLVLIVFGVGARLSVPQNPLMPYLFPAATAAMLVAVLLDIQTAILVAVVSAVMVALNAGTVTGGHAMEVFVYALAGGIVGALFMWRMEQIGAFFQSAVYVALVNLAVIVAFRLPTYMLESSDLTQLLVAGAINALLCASLTFVAFAFLGRVFGIATSLQLLELARPTHPLFQQLLINAPGTYHHSIVISNMAERAAGAIGADTLLSRVGSYYHDIGKVVRPYFFAENQSDGENPHDKLDPRTSAEIIIAHTTEGLALAKKYRLPERVCAFIPEHHGTTLVTYFYRRANQESDEDLDENDFRYPGPKPQSKETAIVMLADSVEAWVRANRPGTAAEMERVIRQVINDRLISGQLDECDLTLRDLDSIRQAFVSVLQGIFHPRVQYPEPTLRRNTGHAAATTRTAETK